MTGSRDDAPARGAVVLAGGHSTRFGGPDKALAELDGVAMVRHVVDRLAAVVDSVVVPCREPQVAGIRRALVGSPVETAVVVDDVPDRGPVGGLLTGVRATDAPMVAVAGCDMPRLDPEFVDWLFAESAGATGAVPVFDGERQPLCAVYRSTVTGATCLRSLAAGKRRLRDVVASVGPAVVPEETVRDRTTAATFENVNSQADLTVVEGQVTAD
ncbi:molybdenum cofactor guanylyltransferase [Haloarchaeobius amylolyticus]|uniref:molybdenum cofactor guanylyltransferase n=1 Tax=Haloarchaeobius amylolyticus TaxID=1198296 RepID=UPI00226FBADD